jgi:peptidoglycan/xylan/chitin deacetylase (PgdA/CDA1 family)
VAVRAPLNWEARLMRAAIAASSGRGRTASLLVLIFHRVLPEPDPLLPGEPDAEAFTAILELLRSCFRILPLEEAVRRLRSGTLPRRAACITFDDGYANNCEIALPMLLARGLPATIFVAPGFIDGGRMFNDSVIEAVRQAPEVIDLRSEGLGERHLTDAAARRRLIDDLLERLKYLAPGERSRMTDRVAVLAGAILPNGLMMSAGQVRAVHRSGIAIGAHTVDHPILTSVDAETARQQIRVSRSLLESMIEAPVRAFAYPNGRPVRDYSREHVAMAREAGFEFALSTAWGAATMQSDTYQIPRVAAWDVQPVGYGLRLARAYRQRSYATA